MPPPASSAGIEGSTAAAAAIRAFTFSTENARPPPRPPAAATPDIRGRCCPLWSSSAEASASLNALLRRDDSSIPVPEDRDAAENVLPRRDDAAASKLGMLTPVTAERLLSRFLRLEAEACLDRGAAGAATVDRTSDLRAADAR